MPLFTVVVEHAGGTYIAQVSAPSVIRALRAWALQAPSLGIPGIGPAFPSRALKDELFLDPTPIEGVRNVWHAGISVRGSSAWLTVVATSEAKTAKGRSSLERLLARTRRGRISTAEARP